MSKGSGVSRGDKRRNARLAELRRLVPRENAIIGIDLAEDNQAVVVTDHDSKVLARLLSRIRSAVEHAVAKVKTWRMLSEEGGRYRCPLEKYENMLTA